MDERDAYDDRIEAGDRLVETLREAGVEGDRVLAIPRGALPVGRRVADGLDLPLGVVVGRKVRHPENSDLAIGGVGADGTVWIHDGWVEKWDVDEESLEAAIESEREAVREKNGLYADGELPAVEGETVVVVDDGAATGATARVCLQQLHELGAERAVIAVPVASELAVDLLEGVADEFVCPWIPSDFYAVWEYYEEFDQVPDDEAMAYLD